MSLAVLHIQCQDNAGKTGTFLRYLTGQQATPTFPSCADLFDFLRQGGWVQMPYHAAHPTGVWSDASASALGG